MTNTSFLLYGANGYTGQLILKLAADYGLNPVLAGRNKKEIERLATTYNLPYHIANLEDPDQMAIALTGVSLLVNAAGPFSLTARPAIKHCLQHKVHYLDITGEISVFEMAKTYNEAAIAANIMVLPGAGFDVVPTDCIALFLKESMPDAHALKLAFTSIGGGLSHGTATTMIEGLGEGGAARVEGKIVTKPLGEKGMWVDFGEKKVFVMTIPWGDVSTAYTTTGIPNIETYTGISPNIYKVLKAQNLFNWLLRKDWIRHYLKNKIDKNPRGPSDEQRAKSKSLVWGQVTNMEGAQKTARISCPDGYTLTAHTSLIIAKKILNGNYKTGYQTPAGAYGADLILEVPRTHREIVL